MVDDHNPPPKKRTLPAGMQPWKPGQSGNPNGRPKTPEDIIKARKLNNRELERLLNKYLWMPQAEVLAATKDNSLPMAEHMIANIMSRAGKDGDQTRLNFVLDRLIGKVADTVQITTRPSMIVHQLDGTRIELGQAEAVDVEAKALPPGDKVT